MSEFQEIKENLRSGDQKLVAERIGKSKTYVCRALGGHYPLPDAAKKELIDSFQKLHSFRKEFLSTHNV